MKVNRVDIAKVMAVSKTCIDNWINEGMPFVTRGGRGKQWEFDTKEVIDWYMTRGNEGDDAEQLKLRKLKAETELAEIKAMTEAELLVPLDESEQHWTSSVLEFKSYILQMPSRVSSQLLGVRDESEIKEILIDAINESLEIFSATEFECEEEDE